jgi:hypothetical protein
MVIQMRQGPLVERDFPEVRFRRMFRKMCRFEMPAQQRMLPFRAARFPTRLR